METDEQTGGDVMPKKARSSSKSKKKVKTTTQKAVPVREVSDDNFVWKVGFFVLLALVIILGVVFWVSQSDGMPKPTTTTNGTVTIIEYSDFECPFCGRAAPTIEQIKDRYGDQVEIVFKHFPLSFHPNAQKASEAAECAKDQGKFWEMHDILFANQNALTVANLKTYASDLGLDTAKFNTCLDSGSKAAIVAKDMQEGQALGVSGTPTFFIGTEKLVGAQPLSAFVAIIDKQLGSGGAPAPVPADDPEFEFLVIDDPSCASCSTDEVVGAVTTQLFTSAKVRTINVDSDEAKELIEQYDLIAVPAFFFGKEVAKAANYNRVAQILQDKGDYYMIDPGAAGNVKYLETPSIGTSATIGDADAAVTIIEFSDFECPFCKRFYDDAYKQIKSTYVDSGDVRVVFKHFPLSFHPNAQKASEATECAKDQGKFWEMHDMIFENQQAIAIADLKGYASNLGLNTATFNTCLDSGSKAAIVQADLEEGRRFGVSGTPGFFVNGIFVSGAQPFSEFQKIINAELS